MRGFFLAFLEYIEGREEIYFFWLKLSFPSIQYFIYYTSFNTIFHLPPHSIQYFIYYTSFNTIFHLLYLIQYNISSTTSFNTIFHLPPHSIQYFVYYTSFNTIFSSTTSFNTIFSSTTSFNTIFHLLYLIQYNTLESLIITQF